MKSSTEREKMISVKRGEIYSADLSPVWGSEQGGVRPVLIIQNDVGNYFSPTVIVAAITSRPRRKPLPTHVFLAAGENGLSLPSIVLTEQMRTLEKQRLSKRIGQLSEEEMRRVDQAIRASLGLQSA